MSEFTIPTTPSIETASLKPLRPIRARWVFVAVIGVALLGVVAAHIGFGSISVAVRYLRGSGWF